MDSEKWDRLTLAGPAARISWNLIARAGQPGVMRISMINVLLVAALSATAAQAETAVIYSDEFSDYYPEIVSSHPGMSAQFKWENLVVVDSPLKTHRASFMRTDGASVPQEKSVGTIVIRPPTGKMQFLFFKRFRSVSFSWINERLLHIESNIGHAGSVDAIYDALDEKWIFRKSVAVGQSEKSSVMKGSGKDCPPGERPFRGLQGPGCCPDGAVCD